MANIMEYDLPYKDGGLDFNKATYDHVLRYLKYEKPLRPHQLYNLCDLKSAISEQVNEKIIEIEPTAAQESKAALENNDVINKLTTNVKQILSI